MPESRRPYLTQRLIRNAALRVDVPRPRCQPVRIPISAATATFARLVPQVGLRDGGTIAITAV